MQSVQLLKRPLTSSCPPQTAEWATSSQYLSNVSAATVNQHKHCHSKVSGSEYSKFHSQHWAMHDFSHRGPLQLRPTTSPSVHGFPVSWSVANKLYSLEWDLMYSAHLLRNFATGTYTKECPYILYITTLPHQPEWVYKHLWYTHSLKHRGALLHQVHIWLLADHW